MKFHKGLYQIERIEALCKELTRVLTGTDGMKLSEAVPLMEHHYKDDRCAIISIARYFGMGEFPSMEYKKGGFISLKSNKYYRHWRCLTCGFEFTEQGFGLPDGTIERGCIKCRHECIEIKGETE